MMIIIIVCIKTHTQRVAESSENYQMLDGEER